MDAKNHPKTAIVEAENTSSKALFQVCRVEKAMTGVTRPLKPIIIFFENKSRSKTSKSKCKTACLTTFQYVILVW